MAHRIDEFDLIRRYFAPLTQGAPGALELRDDAAWLRPGPGMDLVVSTDAVVAGVHFPESIGPADIARRALRVNLSDIAAKGARPHAYTLSLVLPESIGPDWIEAFAAALGQDQQRYGIFLLGGDTSSTPGPLMLNINIFGQTSENKIIKRSGAVVGEDVYVTGNVGDAMLGLASLMDREPIENPGDRSFLEDRFRRPEPRIDVGLALVDIATAAADVSDGLIADLGHICAASQIAATVELDAVPLSDAARRVVTDNQPLRINLLTGGDDYEIVFTAPVSARDSIQSISTKTGVLISPIGATIEKTSGTPDVIVRDGSGNPVEVGVGGYRHFGEIAR